MIDRLEELLALLEEEDDEDEREDALGLRAEAAVPAAPASEIETEKAAEGGGKRAAGSPMEDVGPLAETGTLSWMPDGRMHSAPAEGPGEVPGADGMAGGAAESGTVKRAVEFWWDELAAPVMGQNGAIMLKRPGAGEVEIAELAGTSRQMNASEELGAVMGSMTAAEKGLEGLYRQTVQAGHPVTQGLPVEQAGRTVRAGEPGRTAALTVDEMDRAVRRDSRRYDGGMMIF